MRQNLDLFRELILQDVETTSMSVELPSAAGTLIVPHRIWGSYCALIAVITGWIRSI
jgi:hypothetical protein